MKKMITLLLALGVFSSLSVFAQSGDDYGWRRNDGPGYNAPNSNTVVLDRHGRDYDDYRFDDFRGAARREADQINWRYDRKIDAVEHNPYMSFYEKDRVIRRLQEERRMQIRMVYARFYDRR